MTNPSLPKACAGSRGVVAAVLLALLLCAAGAVQAVPPPPQREARIVDLRGDAEASVEGEVRAYDGESISFEAHAGEAVLARLVDAAGVLSLSLESPSGAPLIDGARPSTDGLRVVLAESGTWQVRVRMDADAARTGRSARFELALRLLR